MTQAFQEHVALKFQLYNSLFLTLPFGHIHQTGNYLPLLTEACEKGFAIGKSPVQIMDKFFLEYFPTLNEVQRNDILFNFIQYIERQIVLFDSVEDAAFNAVNDTQGQGTIKGLFQRAKFQNRTKELLENMDELTLRIVLTAHPTQFYPGSVLGIITDLQDAIKDNNIEEVDSFLRQLGKTPFLKKEKPTPYDEAISLIWYLENVFYTAISNVVFKVEEEMRNLGQSLNFERIIQMGFWPGGDRDGNPFVTTEITKKVAARLKRTIQILYFRDIRLLKRRLTFPGVQEKVDSIEKKLYAGINMGNDVYNDAEQLLDDLRTIKMLLLENHDGLFLKELNRMITRVKIFGLYLAIIDIRQDSSEIDSLYDLIIQKWSVDKRNTWKEVGQVEKIELLETLNKADLDIETETDVQKDTLASFSLMQEIQNSNGARSCHRYIISNTQSAVHILKVFHLARVLRSDLEVDIVPLFETIDDLQNAANEMELIYGNEQYREHLESRDSLQSIMLGFSDGTKDGGYLSANWSIYRAKETLTEVSRKYGIKVAFFDGRGGPPARGGGNSHKFYASLGSKIEDKQVQITIQGQTISSNFGTLDSAAYNMEQLFSAGLENKVFKGSQIELDDKQRLLLEDLNKISLSTYVKFKNHPRFLDYLEDLGTLPYYGETNIGSRPVKRAGGGKLTLQKLRAIPFVGSWSQMKQNVPGYFGLGSALAEFKEAGRLDEIKELYEQSLFFQALIQNSMMALSKCYFPLTAYLKTHPTYGDIWNLIHDEYQTTKELILYIAGEKELLEFSPDTKASINLREKLVLPLLTIQQYALANTRSNGENDMSSVYHKMVLRTMFGIINAGRNSA